MVSFYQSYKHAILSTAIALVVALLGLWWYGVYAANVKEKLSSSSPMAAGSATLYTISWDKKTWGKMWKQRPSPFVTAAHQPSQIRTQWLRDAIKEDNLLHITKHLPTMHGDITSFPQVHFTATGYTAGYESTGKRPDHPLYGITYSGIRVRRDVVSTIAADPTVLPIGSFVYIPGYGYGLVADTGSAIKGKRIDLYFDSPQNVYSEWGKRDVGIYVIERGNGEVTEERLESLNRMVSDTVYNHHPQTVVEAIATGAGK